MTAEFDGPSRTRKPKRTAGPQAGGSESATTTGAAQRLTSESALAGTRGGLDSERPPPSPRINRDLNVLLVRDGTRGRASSESSSSVWRGSSSHGQRALVVARAGRGRSGPPGPPRRLGWPPAGAVAPAADSYSEAAEAVGMGAAGGALQLASVTQHRVEFQTQNASVS